MATLCLKEKKVLIKNSLTSSGAMHLWVKAKVVSAKIIVDAPMFSLELNQV